MSQKEHRFRNWKNTKFSSVAWIMAILVLVIAVVINMIIARLDFSWDISPNKQYSLSSTTGSEGRNRRLLSAGETGRSGKGYGVSLSLSCPAGLQRP